MTQGRGGPTLEELSKALGRHQSLPLQQQIFDDPPPEARLVRTCRECGDALPVWRLGWGEIQEAVGREKEPEYFSNKALCNRCQPKEEADDV